MDEKNATKQGTENTEQQDAGFDPQKTEGNKQQDAGASTEEFRSLVESLKKEVADRDRAISKISEKVKNLELEKMTEEEKFKLQQEEFQRSQAEFEATKAEFNRERMSNYAGDKLASSGYLDGCTTEEISALKKMVLADTPELIDLKISALGSTIAKVAQKKIAQPATPSKSFTSGSPASFNPWEPDQWNVTEQHKLFSQDPERAKALKGAVKK